MLLKPQARNKVLLAIQICCSATVAWCIKANQSTAPSLALNPMRRQT